MLSAESIAKATKSFTKKRPRDLQLMAQQPTVPHSGPVLIFNRCFVQQ